CEIVRIVDLVGISDAHSVYSLQQLLKRRDLIAIHAKPVMVEYKLRLYLAVEAFHRRSGDNSFGRTADAHQCVNVSSRDRSGYTCRKIAVGDQTDTGARRPNIVDQLLVPFTVE